jgi:hypothetical protein
MKLETALFLCGALSAVACGSGSDAPPTGTDFAGTLQVTGPAPGGTSTCVSTTVVTFNPGGADRQSVSLAGGGCLEFVNRDSTVRRPAGSGTSPCAELNGPALAKDETFTTVPLDGPRTCLWQDALHPPPGGGPGGGH